jgi:hypothetical protein
MKRTRIALAAFTAAGVTALAACHGSAIADEKLTLLLHAERAPATDPKAPLDAMAIDCMRTWSNDIELTANLPPVYTGDTAKANCRKKLDTFLNDATRNPDKVAFDDVTRTVNVRRAMALLAEHRGAAVRPPTADDRPPRMAAPRNTAATPPVPGTPSVGGNVDLGTASANVDKIDTLCQEIKKRAALADPKTPMARYAGFCDRRVESLRQRITALQQNGTEQQAGYITSNTQHVLDAAQRLLDTNGASPPRVAPPKTLKPASN